VLFSHAQLPLWHQLQVPGNVGEFAAYSLLYACVSCGLKGVGGAVPRHALMTQLASLGQPHNWTQLQQRQQHKKGKKARHVCAEESQPLPLLHPHVQHALAVIQAFRISDWQGFVRLYKDAPCMSPYLMDKLLNPLRKMALRVREGSFTPTFAASHL